MIRASLALLGCLCTLGAAEAGSFSVPSFTLGSSGPVAPAQAVAAGFPTLHFDTEFSTGLNVGTAGPWYNPGVWYQAVGRAPTNAGGVLNLFWAPGDPGTGVTVGTMKSNGLINTSWQYGYVEVSMAFPPVAGEWPAIWMENNTATTSYVPTAGAHSYGELDIFEWQSQIPTTFNGTVHAWVAPAGSQVTDQQNNDAHNTAALPSGTNLANFNTYGMLWTPTQVSWYFNNKLLLTATSATYPTVFNIFNAGPMYLMLSNQVGTNWKFGNAPPTSTVDMTVQWVHVWGK